MKEIVVLTLSSPYKEIKGTLLTPGGKISIIKQNRTFKLNMPSGVKARIPLSEIKKLKGNSLKINHKTFVLSEIKEDIVIENGENTLEIKD